MSEDTVELHLAKWGDRFFAWLIDFVIVIVVVEAFLRAATLPFWLDNDPSTFFNNMEPLHYLIRSLAFFAYWTFFESSKGQSIGKMILHLKTVDLTGKNASVRNIAVASFGKAFLLHIDLILGWIFTNEKRQRVFNKISDTIIIKIKEQEGVSTNVRYSKE